MQKEYLDEMKRLKNYINSIESITPSPAPKDPTFLKNVKYNKQIPPNQIITKQKNETKERREVEFNYALRDFF